VNARLAVAGTAAAAVVAPSAHAAQPHTVSAERIERGLIAGRAVIEDNATIHGDVNLHNYAGTIENSFVCNRCTFDRAIILPHAVFKRGIDLSGSTIKGTLRLGGALFKEPALFKETQLRGQTDFAFAAFDDLAFFRGSTFDSRANFTSAQFRSVARFGAAAFGSSSSFDEALFADQALFTQTKFVGVARFPDTVFGSASDFRGASFLAGRGGKPGMPGAIFSNANFVGRAEFSNAVLPHEAVFDGARFGSDALFVATTLGADTPAVSFENTAVGGLIDLRRLNEPDEFNGSVQFRNVSADALVFDEIRYGPSAEIHMDNVGANKVSLTIYDERHLDAASPEERKILHTAEETAKSAGNLRLANDLHYRIQEIARGEEVWPQRILDHAFYRGVAGYFVRPFRPLYWLLGLVIFAAVVRAQRWKTRKPGPVRRAWLRFVYALEYTITRRGDVPVEPKPLRRLELTAYAVLLACFLVALANANATLRDMVDAII
jgi:hypothetical protein